MVITALVQLEGQINVDRLITELSGVVKRFRRLRQRIIRPHGMFQRAYWEDYPNQRIMDHLELAKLPLPADEDALKELVSKTMSKPLDFAYPLWRVILVDNYAQGSVLIIQIHHTIADGISLLHVLSYMTQTSPDGPANLTVVGGPTLGGTTFGGPTVGSLSGNGHQPDRKAGSPAIPAAASGGSAPITSPGTPAIRKPNIGEIIVAMLRVIFRPADPQTILKGQLGLVKKAVWTEPLSLPELKIVAQYYQCTINDLLMAIASGAVRRYLEQHHANPKRDIRAFIMVNLRGQTVDEDLGNKFGLVFLTLPLGSTQPTEILSKTKQGMDILKASAEYAATYTILHILGIMPEWVENIATKIFDSKGTVVGTNVPGPRQQLYLAGAPIKSVIAWVPQSGRIGVGLSFVSYNDQLVVGFNVDAGVISDPENFIKLFLEEYQSFQAALPVEAVNKAEEH